MSQNVRLWIEKQLRVRELTIFNLFLECYFKVYGYTRDIRPIELDAYAYVNDGRVPPYMLRYHTEHHTGELG